MLEIENGFDKFTELPHRLEFVAQVNGISFVNDSKATNTGAVIGALDQLKDDIVLIAGKGHEDYQIIGKTKIHLDDREVVRDYMKEVQG